MKPWNLRLTFYRDSAGEYRWTLRHRNGRVVGASTEGYKRGIDARKNAQLVTRYRRRVRVRKEYK